MQNNDVSPWLYPLVMKAWQHGLFSGNPPLRSSNDTSTTGFGATLFADDFELGHLGNWIDEAVQEALVCEQLILGSFSGINDFPPQHDQTLCAGRVHKNPHPSASLAARCVREELFEVADKPLLAGQPRPDFSPSGFCQSCHDTQAHIDGLRPEALTPGAVAREQDNRRQPLDHIPILAGCIPDYEPFPSDDPRCALGQFLMDWIFDYNGKVEPE